MLVFCLQHPECVPGTKQILWQYLLMKCTPAPAVLTYGRVCFLSRWPAHPALLTGRTLWILIVTSDIPAIPHSLKSPGSASFCISHHRPSRSQSCHPAESPSKYRPHLSLTCWEAVALAKTPPGFAVALNQTLHPPNYLFPNPAYPIVSIAFFLFPKSLFNNQLNVSYWY